MEPKVCSLAFNLSTNCWRDEPDVNLWRDTNTQAAFIRRSLLCCFNAVNSALFDSSCASSNNQPHKFAPFRSLNAFPSVMMLMLMMLVDQDL